MNHTLPLKIALGPILYFWEKPKILDFYDGIRDTPIDIIYLGETVCAKRRSLLTDDWIELARELSNTGKEVVLSSLTLLESSGDLKNLRKLCDNGEFTVEANDIAAVQILSENGVPFTTGPAVNIYNSRTLELLHKQGLKRWVMPVEMSREALAELLQAQQTSGVKDTIETEVFAYGRMPLAYSARCFTARAADRPKDDCQLECIHYPEGIPLDSQEGQHVFNINGIQTQSADFLNLLDQWQDMAAMGVDILRISPELSKLHHIIEQLAQQSPLPADADNQCNGYWFGRPGLDRVALPN